VRKKSDQATWRRPKKDDWRRARVLFGVRRADHFFVGQKKTTTEAPAQTGYSGTRRRGGARGARTLAYVLFGARKAGDHHGCRKKTIHVVQRARVHALHDTWLWRLGFTATASLFTVGDQTKNIARTNCTRGTIL